MNLLFINPDHHDFNVTTPAVRPLGGSQSALCYLCLALAKRGHRVVLASATSSAGNFDGVQCITLVELPAMLAAGAWDAVIVLNRADYLPVVRRDAGRARRIVFWTGHNITHADLVPLQDPGVRDACDRCVLVSEWQRTGFSSRFRIPLEKSAVIRNAIAPAFEQLFASRDELAEAKPIPAVLAYTNAPLRGLSLLADIYAELARRDTEVALRIFSGMALYQRRESAELEKLYEKCKALPRTEYAASIAQPQLAAQLRSCHLLTYPNTFAETSCIAMMEAMGAGCLVVSSDFGGLPETAAGYAMLVPVAFRSLQDYANAYFEALTIALGNWQNNRQALLDQLWQQVQFVNQHYTWAVRAAEWEAWLSMHSPPAKPAS
jgi:glycosyltransferase involved in cell wall biosynthesis